MLNHKEINKRFFSVFTEEEVAGLPDLLGVGPSAVSNWRSGAEKVPWRRLSYAVAEKGVSWDWLLTGAVSGPAGGGADGGRASNVRSGRPIDFVLEARGIPVVGEAAADETEGSRAGFFPPDPEARYDELIFPDTTAAVRIIGDSMSPVLLHGQYALLGPMYMGPRDKPRNHDIVVAQVEVAPDAGSDADARWEGVYCKRIVDAGDVWVFLSINTTGTPFTAAKANCRVWPVLGVWFAGMGKTPEP